MKFGVFVPQGWRLDLPADMNPKEQWNTIVKVALKSEELGFDILVVYDHFHTVPEPLSGRSVFEAWTLLAALAPLTKRIRLSQLVTCNLYRNPAYLAKISSVIDVISCGRLELGIGACWYEHEFKGYGYSFPPAKDRIMMLEEAIQIIKKMWTEPEVHFNGKYYTLEGALNDPKPLQKPHPPVLIGGGGEKFTLRVVAKYADKWNIGGDFEKYVRKARILEEHCKDVGRDFKEIVLTHVGTVIIGRTEEEVREKFEKYEAVKIGGISYEDWRKTHYIGTPEEIAEKIEKFKEIGVEEIYLYFPYAGELEPLEFFRDEVMKQFK